LGLGGLASRVGLANNEVGVRLVVGGLCDLLGGALLLSLLHTVVGAEGGVGSKKTAGELVLEVGEALLGQKALVLGGVGKEVGALPLVSKVLSVGGCGKRGQVFVAVELEQRLESGKAVETEEI
jgi:hypothetical protein